MKNTNLLYRGHRFSPEIISHAVCLYHRFCLSFRDVEDLLAERGVVVSYETIRRWCRKFGSTYAQTIKKRRGRLGDTWYLDEVFIVTVRGERRYLWRAVDQDGDVLDILVQKSKDKGAAKRFFRGQEHNEDILCAVLGSCTFDENDVLRCWFGERSRPDQWPRASQYSAL